MEQSIELVGKIKCTEQIEMLLEQTNECSWVVAGLRTSKTQWPAQPTAKTVGVGAKLAQNVKFSDFPSA